jgi:hypothetical protein
MFCDIINALPLEGRRFRTLGGRSSFFAMPSVNGNHIIITSSGGMDYPIDENLFNQVRVRYRALGEELRTMTGQYEHQNWPECPGTVQSPYVAALIHYRLQGVY